MFGGMCCTFIPNNMAADGSVTRALEGLQTLSKAMHEHFEIDIPLEGWMTSVFGQWKGFVLSVMVSFATFLAITVTCGCILFHAVVDFCMTYITICSICLSALNIYTVTFT